MALCGKDSSLRVSGVLTQQGAHVLMATASRPQRWLRELGRSDPCARWPPSGRRASPVVAQVFPFCPRDRPARLLSWAQTTRARVDLPFSAPFIAVRSHLLGTIHMQSEWTPLSAQVCIRIPSILRRTDPHPVYPLPIPSS